MGKLQNETTKDKFDKSKVATKFLSKVLENAIKMGGSTIRTYSSVDGVHGLFQNELLIHGKDKGTCPNCNNKIEKIRIGGRGTYYCPKCQK